MRAAGRLTRARELQNEALALSHAGRPARALRKLRHALGLIEKIADGGMEAERDAVAARIWVTIANCESELSGFDRGVAALAEADRLAERGNDDGLRVAIHNVRAYMALRSGRLTDALAQFDRAARLVDRAEPPLAFTVLSNRGGLHLFRGDLSAARTDLTRALEIAARHDVGPREQMARHNLGYLEFLAGNLGASLALMESVAGQDVQVQPGVSLLDRSRVLIEAGLYREADDVLAQAADVLRAERVWQDLGEVELARAECALNTGDEAAARRFALSARARFRRRGSDRWRRRAELLLLQADVATGRSRRRTAAEAQRLAAELRAEGLAATARSADLIAAEALLCASDPDAADAVLRRVQARTRTDPIATRMHAWSIDARLRAAAGDVAGARARIRSGLRELSTYQARFGGIDMRTASAVHGRQLADLDVGLALGSARAAAVWASVERTRSMSSRLPRVVSPEDPVAAELLGELRQAVEEARSAGPRSTAARRLSDLERQLRSRSWRTEGAGDPLAPAALPVAKAALAEHGAVQATYVEHDDALFAVVVTPDRTRLVSLGESVSVAEAVLRVRADLDALAGGRVPAPIRAAVGASLRRSLDHLDSALVRRLRLPDAPLVVVPTGALTVLPWGLLPSLRARPVVAAPSATAWLAAATPAHTEVRAVSLFAGPDLARAGDEIEAVAKAWPGAAMRAGEDAGHALLAEALTSDTVVHVAAHGEHQQENPLFSSVRMADAPFFAYELDLRGSAAPHVILSACELGRATVRPGGEALGLTSVLLHLGSTSVISSVARVRDDIAADVMGRYHRDLAAGADSATALAKATAHQADEEPAPFVAFGAAWRRR